MAYIQHPDCLTIPIGAKPHFLWEVIKTMQNYRDNTQATCELPRAVARAADAE
jgi:hypothetical protein